LDDLTCLFCHPTRPTSRLPGPCSTRQDVSAAAHWRAQTDACCREKLQQTDNNRLKISIGLNNHLEIAYSAFQCLPVLYQVRHFRYRYRYRNRYRFSISIGGIGGIVLTLVPTGRCTRGAPVWAGFVQTLSFLHFLQHPVVWT